MFGGNLKKIEGSYNVTVITVISTYQILDISLEELNKVVGAYERGQEKYVIDGHTYSFDDFIGIEIYTFESKHNMNGEELYKLAESNGWLTTPMLSNPIVREAALLKVGKRVTGDFIKEVFGSKKKVNVKTKSIEYVDESRIIELEGITDKDFDYTKLIAFLRELQFAFENDMFLTVPLLVRAIIDHIPPVFGKNTFNEFCGSYGTKSFKEQMERLEKMSRKIADSYLHTPIRKSESLPNRTQINFSNELDVLLQEIVRTKK